MVLAIAALAVVLIATRAPLRRAGYRAGLRDTPELRSLPVGEFLGTAFIGGFRAVAVNVAWVRSMRLQQEQKWYELLALYDVIANLQPRMEPVWMFNAWNMAYNISNAVDDEATAWEWVKRGLEFLARGCERNPRSWRLRTTLAQMYFTRCGSINDERTRYYHRRLYEETGRSNWEWCIEWTRRAIEVSDEVPTYSRNYIAVSMDRMAREALRAGDIERMRVLRYEAIREWGLILREYPDYEPAMKYMRDTEERLRGYDLREEAARRAAAGDLEGWLQVAGEITTIWQRLLAADPWDDETVERLKEMAKGYSEHARAFEAAGMSAQSAWCVQESERLWRILAQRTTDEEAAAYGGQVASPE